MKKLLVALLLLVIASSAFAEEFVTGPKLGIRVASDASVSFLFLAGILETGVSAHVDLYDGENAGYTDTSLLLPGIHLALLFRTAENIRIGLGAEGRYGFGEFAGSGYTEYVDVAPRLQANFALSPHLLLSGILYPLWFHAEETDADGSFWTRATIPTAAVAVAYLF